MIQLIAEYFLDATVLILAALLLWTIGDRVAEWLHEREIKREREASLARMIDAWRSKDMEFHRQQRRIRGEE